MHFINKISTAFAWNHLNKITGYLLDFALSVVLARGLGDYYYGIFAELWNFIFLFSLISSAGIDTAINVFLPKVAENAHQISYYIRRTYKFFGTVAAAIIMLLLFSGSFLAQLVHSPELGPLLKIGAFYVVLYSFLIITQAILLSFYATKFLFWANTVLKTSMIIFSYLVLKNNGSLEHVIWSMIGINALISGAYYFRIFRFIRPKPEPLSLVPFYKFGFIAWITSFINYLLGRYFDIFLLGYFLIPKAEIGYYNISFSFTMAMAAVFTSGFSGITTAAFAQFEQQNKRHIIAEGWLRITKICIFFSLPMFLFVIFNARLVILAIYKEAYIQSAGLLQVFAVFYLISVIMGSGTNSSLLYSINKEKVVLTIRAIFGMANVLLDILLIPLLGAMGAIIASGSSIVMTIGAELIFAQRFARVKFPALFLLKISLAAVASLAVSYFVQTQGLPNLIINASVFVSVFLIGLFFLKPFKRDDLARIACLDFRLGSVLLHFCED